MLRRHFNWLLACFLLRHSIRFLHKNTWKWFSFSICEIQIVQDIFFESILFNWWLDFNKHEWPQFSLDKIFLHTSFTSEPYPWFKIWTNANVCVYVWNHSCLWYCGKWENILVNVYFTVFSKFTLWMNAN